ncbi:MAG: glycoside hydrolase family 25 protein [Lachnospiraceae bacterium]|nr:glycoside hydrolase family 25 protein [Lachnospiraceae bacterium]
MQRTQLIKYLLVVASVIMLVMIGVIIGINIKKDKDTYPRLVIPNQLAWTFKPGEEAAKIEDNYWRFAEASYILIGEYPNYEYYKIAPGAPRNDYVKENFYIENGNEMYYHNEAGERQTTITIDVSEFQGDIDWQQVKDEGGVDMAIVRVGYRGYSGGSINEDSMFYDNVSGAKEAGLKVGVYFYSQAINYDEGVEEAQFVLSNIAGLGIDGPVVIDTEDAFAEGARTNGISIQDRTDSVVAFCETVKASGYEPMIYANRNWYAASLDMSRLCHYKLWLAQYSNMPSFPYQYVGWQYTDTGFVYGVEGSVDMNVWFE